MMKKADDKIKKILEKQISLVKPSDEEIKGINEETRQIVGEIEKNLKKKKIKAEVFVGGSLAKGTLIRKKDYDIDIFVRFFENKDISELNQGSATPILKKAERVHGSRDYFRVRRKNILFEIIPVLKINHPEEAKNITDLSYFHVSYVLNETRKNKKLAEEIMLAKSFCFSKRVYGAESYIRGFSGYALELLVSHYKSFLGFIRAVNKEKRMIVIDPKKFYSNREDVLNQLNESKLASPIVFVDPTFKQRNALAALSSETFSKFKTACSLFLKRPSEKSFEDEKIDEKSFNLILEASTNRQEGDIAGSKLLKFSRLFSGKLERYFKIKKSDFSYDGKKSGRLYLKIEKMKSIIYSGPPINKPERLLAFREKHKNVFIKKHVAYAREKSLSFKLFFNKFLKQEKKVMRGMGITRLRVIKR